jgi:uncharacterized membrane protein (UPF0127 family)
VKRIIRIISAVALVAIILLVVAITAPSRLSRKPSSDDTVISLTFGGRQFTARTAETPAEREKGLSGTDPLKRDEAMLFVLDGPTRNGACMWMKDMKYSIDIAWFDVDKHLIHDKTNVSPTSYPNSYCPPVDAKYVLEFAAGTLSQLSLKSNSEFEFTVFKL